MRKADPPRWSSSNDIHGEDKTQTTAANKLRLALGSSFTRQERSFD